MPEKRYALQPAFERVVVAYVITDAKFMQRIGSALEPECFITESARLVVSCALVYLKEAGKPLTSAVAVSQRLRTLVDKGTLLKEDSLNAGDYMDECLGQKLPDREEVIHELATVVRRHREGVILEKADKLYSKNSSITTIKDELIALEKLGQAVENPTVGVHTAFNMIRAMRRVSRLTTGISELDVLLGGGLARGQMGFAIGPTGSGKSQFLSQLTQAALIAGVNTLVATLEVSVGDWASRVMSGLTEIPQTAVSNGEMTDLAEERFNELLRAGRIGDLQFRDFPAKVTQVEEIFAWVDACNDSLRARTGNPDDSYELIVLDYLDKLGYAPSFGGSYDGMGYVYEYARTAAFDRRMWLWSVSQSKAKEKNSKQLLDAEDAADSRNKGRVTDVCVTLNLDHEQGQVNIFVSKNRTGVGRRATGSIPTDFAFGRLARPTTPSLFNPPKPLVRPEMSQEDFSYEP